MTIKAVRVAGQAALMRDDLSGAGGATMFCPFEVSQSKSWLRWSGFACPTVLCASIGLGLACDPADIAADLLGLLAPLDPSARVVLFGFSAGAILASLVAESIAQSPSAPRVKLILANPVVRWWPLSCQQNERVFAKFRSLLDQAETDLALRQRLDSIGDLLGCLRRAACCGTRTVVVSSIYNAVETAKARQVIEATGAAMIAVPTGDHNLMPWLQPEIYQPAGERAGGLERLLAEQIRRRDPEGDPSEHMGRAMEQAIYMRAFWASHPGLQAMANAL